MSDAQAHRAEIHNQYVKGLFLLNGGASLALLAFLEKIYDAKPRLVSWLLASLLILIVGLVLAGVVNFIRGIVSQKYSANSPDKECWSYFNRSLMIASLLCFLCAMMVVLGGAYIHLA